MNTSISVPTPLEYPIIPTAVTLGKLERFLSHDQGQNNQPSLIWQKKLLLKRWPPQYRLKPGSVYGHHYNTQKQFLIVANGRFVLQAEDIFGQTIYIMQTADELGVGIEIAGFIFHSIEALTKCTVIDFGRRYKFRLDFEITRTFSHKFNLN